jgi:hypothetical protein
VKGVRIAAYDFLPGHTFVVGFVDYLVVDVCDVLDEGNLVSSTPQVPCDHIPEKGSAGVADVNMIVDRRAADVNADLPVLPDLDLLSAKGVS